MTLLLTLLLPQLVKHVEKVTLCHSTHNVKRVEICTGNSTLDHTVFHSGILCWLKIDICILLLTFS